MRFYSYYEREGKYNKGILEIISWNQTDNNMTDNRKTTVHIQTQKSKNWQTRFPKKDVRNIRWSGKGFLYCLTCGTDLVTHKEYVDTLYLVNKRDKHHSIVHCDTN